ncbi:polysaccharide deacetylase family protein [Ornithinibacillus contaminans]|uniref:polysaccharide deacetylase family protein n=1 Tax=Ornithinibacillus contaminans TaxID=694055 RepID=UPI00064D7CB9|nr:polysaccharide deacetylase family protein [Ornithinibacillus contaminans]
MQKKKMLIVLILVMIAFATPNLVFASSVEQDTPSVLVVYSSEEGEQNEQLRLLELILAHFTTMITYKQTADFRASDLAGVTHLVYVGQVKEQLPLELVQEVNAFPYPIFAIGYNAEQFTQKYPFIVNLTLRTLDEITLTNSENQRISVEQLQLLEPIQEEFGVNMVLQVNHAEQDYPLLLEKNGNYYLATTTLYAPVSASIAEAMHDFFAANHDAKTMALLRLEDVNPKLDATVLQEIADYLKQQQIPYLVSVTPVYRNPATEEEYHLSENPGLVQTLKFMQANGGSIVFHGYTDQYGDTETGEGFEFWNKEQNQPVYFPPGEEAVMKTREDFLTEQAYTNYINEKQAFETTYIQNILERGIQELVAYGIYPIAFEAPHYAMSQNGYRIISTYFSTYIGQIQLSDQDWRVMSEAPTITTPPFLHGMTLIPETIRYIRYGEPSSMMEVKDRIQESIMVRDGIISGFYHPFLGKEGLVELIQEMEKIPAVEWMNLSDRTNTVTVNGLTIETSDGEVSISTPEQVDNKQRLTSAHRITDFITVGTGTIRLIVIGGILMVIILVLSYRMISRTNN